MKIYSRRIAFLVSYQTLVPHGGIGQFTKSFVELMNSHNIKVDIITDKQPPTNEFITTIESLGANIVFPDTSIPYTNHGAIFMYQDSFCYERMLNFRNSLLKALSSNLYDSIVCNTYESVQVAQNIGLSDCIQVIAYTHLESQIFSDTKNPFMDSVNHTMRKQLEVPDITIGTQSEYNLSAFTNSSNLAYNLPIPFPEKKLLNKSTKSREGVLFIGRWEEGKNPKMFIDLIRESKLPAKVMTNRNGAKKFEKELASLGVEYEIQTSIIGQDKVDFITSARVAFNPSSVESYGIAFIEQISQLPTVAIEGNRWTNNFDSKYFFTATKKTMVNVVTELYNKFPTPASWYEYGGNDYVSREDATVFDKWNKCFSDFKGKKSNSNTAKICEYDTIKYSEFVESLQRNILCIDDIRSVLTNKHKYNIIYTDFDTFLSKDSTFSPVNKPITSGLFIFE